MEEVTYTESRVNTKKDDFILAYNDGVTEAQNKNGDFYSDDRLVKLLEKEQYNSPKILVDKIIQSIKSFENGAEQFDDITLLVIQCCQ